MVEEPMNLIISKNIMVKIVIYRMETDAFSNVSTIFSTKILTKNISNSKNNIKEEQMLCLDVEYPNFVNDIK